MARCRLGSGALSVAFASVLSPAPIRPFPPPALRTGRADFPHPALQWDHASRTTEHRFGAVPHGTGGFALPRLPEAARLHPRCPSPTCRRACSRLGGTEPPNQPSPGPFAYACDASGHSLPFQAGIVGKATPAGLRPSVISPHLRPLSSTGVTPRLQYYGPLRRPAGPACPSRGPGRRVHGTARASRVATLSIFHACRRQYLGGNRPVRSSLSSQPVSGLPLMTGGVGFRIMRFEACSAFTRVPACMVAEPPIGSPSLQGASAHVVTSMNRPGRYQPERQLLGGVRTHKENAPFHGALSCRHYNLSCSDYTRGQFEPQQSATSTYRVLLPTP